MEKENSKSEYLMKISIIGSEDELKGQFMHNYTGEPFDEDKLLYYGLDISTKKTVINETATKLIFVITANTEFFGQLRRNYYRGASACVVIFDKSDRQSFDAVPYWLKEFRKHIPQPGIPVALVGIETNSKKIITSDEVKALAEQLNMIYFETSSPTFENSQKIFDYLAREVIK